MTDDSERPLAEPLERRRSPRRRLGEHNILSARVRPGLDVAVVDVSAGGALVETVHRLLPGSAIELQLATSEARVSVRGLVLRCAVARLRAGAVWYRGVIGFDRHLPWFVEGEGGKLVPSAEMRPLGLNRGDATHGVR